MTFDRKLNLAEWRKRQPRLCRWCRKKLDDEEGYYCNEEHRKKFNDYQRNYQKSHGNKWVKARKKERRVERRAAKKEPHVFDQLGNEYKVISKKVLNNYQIALMTEEEFEAEKKKLSRRFDSTQVRKIGLVFLKIKKVDKDEDSKST